MTVMQNGHEYTVRKVYVVICPLCNEEIGRAMSGEEPETYGEARALVREHDKTWHPRDDEEAR